MITKTIVIKDNKALKLLESLESINFIKFKNSSVNDEKMDYLLSLKPKNSLKDDTFNDLKGIWKGRDITIEQIRDKAWARRK